MPEGTLPPQPRREYVWRTIERGEQSLATIAHRISLDLEMTLSSLNTLAWTDGQSTYRCAGYIREEITLAPTTRDSAVVSHDTPGPREVCSVCHEVVGLNEALWCICGDPSNLNFPGHIVTHHSCHSVLSQVPDRNRPLNVRHVNFGVIVIALEI